MTDSIHSLVPAYAVDALDAHERALVEHHLRDCADCREDLAGYRNATSALADAEAVAPPATLRARVLGEVERTAQLPPSSDDAPTTDPIRVAERYGDDPAHASAALNDDLSPRRQRRGVRRWMPAIAGAAATLALVTLGFGIAGSRQDDAAELALEKDVMMVTSAPDAQSMDLDLGNGHLVKSDRMDGIALMGADAPMPDEGTEYQVWLVMDDGTKMAGPTFMPHEDGEYMAVVHMDLTDVAAVAVTCEPHGGSDEPTTEMVSLVEL